MILGRSIACCTACTKQSLSESVRHYKRRAPHTPSVVRETDIIMVDIDCILSDVTNEEGVAPYL